MAKRENFTIEAQRSGRNVFIPPQMHGVIVKSLDSVYVQRAGGSGRSENLDQLIQYEVDAALKAARYKWDQDQKEYEDRRNRQLNKGADTCAPRPELDSWVKMIVNQGESLFGLDNFAEEIALQINEKANGRVANAVRQAGNLANQIEFAIKESDAIRKSFKRIFGS